MRINLYLDTVYYNLYLAKLQIRVNTSKILKL